MLDRRLVGVCGYDEDDDDQDYDSDQTEDKLLPSGAVLERKKSNARKIMERKINELERKI